MDKQNETWRLAEEERKEVMRLQREKLEEKRRQRGIPPHGCSEEEIRKDAEGPHGYVRNTAQRQSQRIVQGTSTDNGFDGRYQTKNASAVPSGKGNVGWVPSNQGNVSRPQVQGSRPSSRGNVSR